jgi:hypothetical protein
MTTYSVGQLRRAIDGLEYDEADGLECGEGGHEPGSRFPFRVPVGFRAHWFCPAGEGA